MGGKRKCTVLIEVDILARLDRLVELEKPRYSSRGHLINSIIASFLHNQVSNLAATHECCADPPNQKPKEDNLTNGVPTYKTVFKGVKDGVIDMKGEDMEAVMQDAFKEWT